MTKLPRWPGKDIIKVFRHAGWRLDHIEGSHNILVKEGIDTILVVPVHGTKPIKVGLLKGLINDAGLTNEDSLEVRGTIKTVGSFSKPDACTMIAGLNPACSCPPDIGISTE